MNNTAPAGSTAVTLSESSLQSIDAAVKRPQYSRREVQEGIVHIGVGGFHRAHQAVYIDDLLAAGKGNEWAICGVGILPGDRKMQEVLSAQDTLYTVVERHAEGENARIIGSITKFLYGINNQEAVLQKLTSPETKIVSLTITEGGYCFNQATSLFDSTNPGITHDLNNPQSPSTAFGYLIEALDRRRKSGAAPFTILSCDNLQGNGEVAKKMFLAYAELRDPSLRAWIETNVAFPNTMVDRITPMTTDNDREALEANFSLRDGWPVVTEPFKQWIIEDTFCAGRPALETVGAQFTSDVHPYETMKIRLLNASHSAMGYLGYLAGYQYIHEIISDRDFRRFIGRFMDEEVTPLLSPVPGIDLNDYKRTLIERFSNPTIKDQAARICMDGSSKMPKFILPSLEEQLSRGGQRQFLTLVVAGWIRYLSAVDEKGAPIEINDPMAQRLVEAARKGGDSPAEVVSIKEVFGSLGENRTFMSEVSAVLKSLYQKGSKAVLLDFLAK